MAKKRGHGEGSIYQRTDGRWCASIAIGHDSNGKLLRRYIYRQTKREVTEELTRLQNQKLDGRVSLGTKLTLGEYLDQWLESVKRSVRPSTIYSYQNVLRLHVKEHIGRVKLSGLADHHIHGIYNRMSDAGLSPRMLQMVHTILKRALTAAVKRRLLTFNVMDLVDRPKVPKFEIAPLSANEAAKLLEKARGDRFEPLFVLAVTAGLRQGELLGLKWDDIDLAAATLQVRRTLVQVAGKLSFGEPKSTQSRRLVQLTPYAVDALQDHRRRLMTEGLAGCELVFPTLAGEPMEKSELRRLHWLPLLKRAGLPETVRFHDLRHTAATLLLQDNIHPKIVQTMLGHSTITLTMDTYSHVLPSMHGTAATAMAKRFPARLLSDCCQEGAETA